MNEDIPSRLARIEGKLDSYIEASRDRREAIDRNFAEIREDRLILESRVHCVEKKTWTNSAIVATAITAAKWLFTKS